MAEASTPHSVEQVRARLGAADVQIVDIRDVRELGEALVTGAYHAPRCMLEFWWTLLPGPITEESLPTSPRSSSCTAAPGGAARWRPRRCRTWACATWRIEGGFAV